MKIEPAKVISEINSNKYTPRLKEDSRC